MNTATLIQKVWNFCHTLKDDGVGYGDYLEQLTYLLFLKMAHEYTQEPYNRRSQVPGSCDWTSLRGKTGEPLEAHYLTALRVAAGNHRPPRGCADGVSRRGCGLAFDCGQS
jgi:type I restriction enzyme M protein